MGIDAIWAALSDDQQSLLLAAFVVIMVTAAQVVQAAGRDYIASRRSKGDRNDEDRDQ